MKTPHPSTLLPALLLPANGFAQEAGLPAPVLEWSLYILLIFAACVVIGIFFIRRGKDGINEPLGSLLDEHRPNILSVEPDTSVTECVLQMNQANMGAMLVMQDEELVGIFTERDAIRKVLGAGLDPTTTNVSEVMTREPYCVPPSLTLDEAMGIITHRRVRHLPVVRDGKVLGMISSGDLTSRLVGGRSGEMEELVDITRHE